MKTRHSLPEIVSMAILMDLKVVVRIELTYLLENHTCTCQISIALNYNILLRNGQYNRKHLLNFQWKCIPAELFDFLCDLIERIANPLAQFAIKKNKRKRPE